MTEPILVMALPRSGSSMTAGILAAHGVWVGPNRNDSRRNRKGDFENTRLKKLVIARYGRGAVSNAIPISPVDGFKPEVLRVLKIDGYVAGPWLWKGSVMYYPAWHEFNPTVVVCRRDPEAALQSALRPPFVYRELDTNAIRRVIQRHNQELDRLVAAGAYEVDTQAVAMGDFSSIQRAVEGCGLQFDEKATADFVDPTMWHYKC